MLNTHSRNVSFAGPSIRKPSSPFLDSPADMGEANGHLNGNARKPMPRMPKNHRVTDSQQVRDAEEFELEGLISDVDDDADGVESPKLRNKEAKGQNAV